MALTIHKAQFVPVPSVPNQESVIARYTVPRGYVYRFALGAKFEHTLAVREERVAVNDETTEQVVVLDGDLVQGPWPPERVVTARHLDPDGVVVASGVVSFNTAANEVTANKAPNTGGTIVVEYLTGSGYVRIMRAAPVGSSVNEGPVFEDVYDVLSRINQLDRGSRPTWNLSFNLLEDWSLVVRVNTDHPVAWDSPLTVLSVDADRVTKAQLLQAVRQRRPEVEWEDIVRAELARLD